MYEYFMSFWQGAALWVTAGVVAGLTMLGLRAQLAIHRARARGLWPRLGQIPTESDLLRLVRLGETSLAVRMCRQIHNVSTVAAWAVVRQLSREAA
jgi:hypothetical protein